MWRLSWNMGASTSWNPQGLSRAVMGLLYLCILSQFAPLLYASSFFLCLLLSQIPCYIPLLAMCISTSLRVISIRVAFLLTGRAILREQREPKLHLVMELLYFRRCRTTDLNYMLHPTEEPTHDAHANLWRKLHHTFVYCKCLHQFLVYVYKRLPRRCEETKDRAFLSKFRENSRQDEEPRGERYWNNRAVVVKLVI